MSTLLMRLAAPLQAWGVDAKFERRGTERVPTKSGVIGLVSAALGRRRNETLEDLCALRFGARIDREGQLLRDYHTAIGDHPYVTNRYYLQDAVFLVGLEGDAQLLGEIGEALERPAFPLFLGRRSCPPEGRVLIGLREKPLLEALRDEPPLIMNRTTSAMRLFMDSGDARSGRYQRDVPLSFDSRRREHGFRIVSELILPQTCIALPTDHDPMAELEV